MTKQQQGKLVSVKEIAEKVGITERQARKILRNDKIDKDQHSYFWLFTKKEAKNVERKLKQAKRA